MLKHSHLIMFCRVPAVEAVPAAAAAGEAGDAEAMQQDAPVQAAPEQADAQAAPANDAAPEAQPAAEEPAAAPAEQQPAAAPAQRGGKAPAAGIDLGAFKLPADAILKQEIPLPRRMASCVIGIKGQSVSKLRRESGSKIHVRPATGRDEMDQVVEIEGSIESVRAVQESRLSLLSAEVFATE